MNKYCYKCQSVYSANSAILGRCPKCRELEYYKTRSFDIHSTEKRIYNDKISTKSMDTLKRIENAEEELRLAKLELTNDPNRECINEVTDMLREMSLYDGLYTITESSPSHAKVVVKDGYYFLGRYVLPNWYVNCTARDSELIIIFRRE